MILSSHQQTVLDALLGWLDRGPPVALLEGFPGTGKTSHIASPLCAKVDEAATGEGSRRCLWVRLIEGSVEAITEKLLIDLAAGLEELGLSQPATELQQGTLTPGTLMNFLRRQRLLVIVDEFQSLVNTAGRLASEAWTRAFQNIRPIDPCRVLLLSSQSLDRSERWLEGGFHNSLRGFERTEGAALLGGLLAKSGRGGAVQEDKLGDVSDWLGGIPRAIEMLATELEYTSLEELIQWEPDSWELRDGGASSEFLRRFEERILERALSRLGERERVFLRRLAVLRESCSKEVTEALAQTGDDVPMVLRALVDRMLLQRQPPMGYFAMVPVVRHSVLLNISNQQRLAAHAAAGGYYTKPFFAANTLGKPASLAAIPCR